MRLSAPIKNKLSAPIPLPVKKARDAPVAAAPAPKITRPAPPAKNDWFSISALTKKNNITQAPVAPPVKPMEQEPAVAEMSAKATEEPVIFTPQKNVPVTVNASPVSPGRYETPAKIGKERTGAQTPPGKTFSMTGLMTKKPVSPSPVSPSPVPPPNISEKKEEAVTESPPRIMGSTPPLAESNAFKPKEKPADLAPAGTSAVSPADANASRYNEAPAGIYEACRQFGITVPEDRSTIIEQAKVCLITVFKKILQPSPEKYMIWPVIKSIASDIEGFVASNVSISNVLRHERKNEDKLVWHSIYTSILAMGIAKNEKKLSCSLYEIGGAALLHDVGLLVMKGGYDDIHDGKNNLADHVAKSVELARRLEVPDMVAKMIAEHHGRLDGKGFPKDLSHSTFERCCQILAIASMSELAMHDITLGKKEAGTEDTGENGLAIILKEYRHAFDIDLLKKMITLVGFYPVGSVVELNNRIIGKVIKQNSDFPLRPMVQVVMDGTGIHPEEEKLIDLKEVKILSIIRTLASPEIKNIMIK